MPAQVHIHRLRYNDWNAQEVLATFSADMQPRHLDGLHGYADENGLLVNNVLLDPWLLAQVH